MIALSEGERDAVACIVFPDWMDDEADKYLRDKATGTVDAVVSAVNDVLAVRVVLQTQETTP